MSYKEDPTAHFMMRMTPAEKADLLAKAKRSGLTQAGFVRKAIKGTEVLAIPPAINYTLLQEVRAISIGIGQITRKVNESVKPAHVDADIEQIKAYMDELLKIARAGAGLR